MMDIDTNVLIADIEQKRKEGVRHFTFYVNSDGGEVAQGSALYNYLDRTDIEVTWVVDGIAASMMAVLMTNKKHKVKAAKHAKFMYHRVSGYTYGNSDETRAAASMMDNFEGTLIEMMSERIGKSIEETRKAYFDGIDHWLSAEEAKQAGLCDEIIERNKNIKALDVITDSRSAFNYYNNQIINLNKKTNKMEFLETIASALNMGNATATEVLAKVKSMSETEKTLQNKLEAEQKKNADLENRIKAIEESKIKNLIDGAIADKRIGEDDREAYTKLAEQDFENTEKVLNKMQGVPRVKNGLEPEGKLPKEEADWKFDDYHRQGKLENLKNNNPERYAELFKKKFGFEPKN